MSARKATGRRARSALAADDAQPLLSALVEHLPIGVQIIAVDGHVVLTNRCFEEMFGVTVPSTFDVSETSSTCTLRRLFERAAAGEIVEPAAHVGSAEALIGLRRRDSGTHVPASDTLGMSVEMAAYPVGGRYVIVTFAGAGARESTKMEALARLAGGIAHEFNNLMSVVTMCSDIALEGVGAQSRVVTELREIRGAADRAATLTRQLLAYSRRQVMKIERVDVVKLLRDAELPLRSAVAANVRLEIVEETPDVACAVLADREHLGQVVAQMVLNASEAMTEGGGAGGTITVRVALVADPAPPCVRIVVEDTGRGMSDAVRARMFEPFFTTKGVGEGTGLGLAMVYGVIQDLGGTLSVDSVLGKGTRVTVSLPAK